MQVEKATILIFFDRDDDDDDDKDKDKTNLCCVEVKLKNKTKKRDIVTTRFGILVVPTHRAAQQQL